jgi:3-oxoacyl-[acyl-carrier-protein] synthase III
LGNVIVGTGMSVPDNVVTNDDLARIMDTSDDRIATRTGVRQRRFADPGVGAGALVGFAAFGAGAHYGAALYRVPADP